MTEQRLSAEPAPARGKHRSLPAERTSGRSRPRSTTSAGLLCGVALVATGVAVGGGTLVSSMPARDADASLVAGQVSREISATEAVAEQRDRARDAERVSRSSARVPLAAQDKVRNLSNASGPARTKTEDLSNADPRTLAKALMPQFGMSGADFGCLDAIWTQESGWNVHADNPSSSAYGIPQALPGSKMSSAGSDWENNPVTQIKWGLGYINARYGSACAAAGFKRSHGFY